MFDTSQLLAASGSAGFYDHPIEQSLRFNDDDSAYLSWTPASAGNRKTWTWSGWVKRGNLGNTFSIFEAQDTNNSLRFDSSDTIHFSYYDGNYYYIRTNAVYRDPSAWYHVVVVWDTTNATSSDRMRLYVNGERVTSFSATAYPPLNQNHYINNAQAHNIGRNTAASQYYLDGYLAEVHFIDGTALDASSFGEFKSGVWIPKAYAGSYGTNGFYLDFSEKVPAYNIQAYGNCQHDTAQSKIGGSSILHDGTGDYLDFDTDGLNMLDHIGTGDFTIEFWIRYNAVNTYQWFIGGDTSNMFDVTQYPSSFRILLAGTAYSFSHSPSTGTWYHYAISRENGSLRAFVDGTQVGTTQSSSENINGQSLISGRQFNGQYEFNGWLDEIRLSTVARYTSSFTAPTTAFTADSDTLLLVHSDTTDGSTTFTDSAGVSTGIGTDQSGEGNNFTPNNLNHSDVVLDSPTNNFATLNPLVKSDTANTFTEGNLKASSSGNNQQVATIAMQGKVYWEFIDLNGNASLYFSDDSEFTTEMYYNATNRASIWRDGTSGATGSLSWTVNSGSLFSWTTNDLIGVAYDADNHTLQLTKNGGSAVNLTINGLSGDTMLAVLGNYSSGSSNIVFANFGQDSSFAGNKTAQGNTDDNGYGDFYYAPPTGYLALCTANLTVPDAMNPALDNSPQDYFNTVLYTGDDTNNRTISGVGFDPDLTWIKARNVAYGHIWIDIIRGNYRLSSNSTGADRNDLGFTNTSVTTDGFIVDRGTNETLNESGRPMVAWNWKANGSGVSNTDGSITSTVSANTDAGFSIVSYTGTGSNATVGHGLDSAPEMVITKNRDATQYWIVQHKDLSGVTYNMYLQRTDSQQNDSQYTAISNTTLTVNGASVNTSGNDYISYCFHSVEGFSKFGSFVGNGSSDGPFIFTDFAPAMVLYKNATSAADWMIFDKERIHSGTQLDYLEPNTSDAEGFIAVDLLSNGFKVTEAGGTKFNASGNTYIFAAFAENPFKYSTAR